jgi:hypothetical protein
MRLERVGTVLLVVITVSVLAAVGVSAALKLAADDLATEVGQFDGTNTSPRTQPGIWLSAPLSADLSMSDGAGVRSRVDQLSARSDRLREVAGAGALVGLLVAVLTGQTGAGVARDRDPSIPAANTASTGSV